MLLRIVTPNIMYPGLPETVEVENDTEQNEWESLYPGDSHYNFRNTHPSTVVVTPSTPPTSLFPLKKVSIKREGDRLVKFNLIFRKFF